MALWGNKDSFSNLKGTVTVNYSDKLINGAGTSFSSAGISTGDVIAIGVGNTFGEAVISGVTSETQISIASTQFLSGAAIAGIAYTVSQQPVYALGIGETARGTLGPALIYGVDANEATVAAATTAFGKEAGFAVAHAGWVAVAATYTDSNGNTRIKSETLVAGGADFNGQGGISTSFDAEDDTRFPDS
jgi:hypothetical protein|tara:strand:+ start:23 stop:589 length:567 start_codon:yes stop_codon:yes gene_type:complete